jgi:hypothetical protein
LPGYRGVTAGRSAHHELALLLAIVAQHAQHQRRRALLEVGAPAGQVGEFTDGGIGDDVALLQARCWRGCRA